ncbi:hypothetical protein PVL29_004518 [Vitis rotundifolia]|uniref:Peptidase A1 domain-containing protein n=1 Tax=Vitis rotundifolia TaxID=103349 RepID=A0AA39A987_VITRO|nr:hypothetical protein PVL29_004518 [Vitis rotundifolia]
MAILCPSTAIYHLLFSFLLLFFLCYVSNTPVYGAAKDGYHTLDISSLLPKNNYSAPAGGLAGGLPITYSYGPCSRSGQKKSPSRQQIFLQDRSRVRSINAKIFSQYSTQESKDDWSLESLPSSNKVGDFLVNVGFGNPQQTLDLSIDTGSPTTWIQCNSFLLEKCHNKKNCNFTPSLSSSYYNGSCIPSTDTTYDISYEDGSYSKGVFGCDEVALKPDVLPKFQFGCSRDSGGDFGASSGILGLAQGEQYSLISQTASKFKKKFSYCFPPIEDTQGSLLFGEKAISASPLLKFTRILNPPSGLESRKYYFVELIGISVAKKRLNVSSSLFASPGTIIDSGTVVTHLPTAAYKALRTAFQQEMLHCPSIPPPRQEKLLDTCYNLKGCGGRNITLPEIVLHFGGEVDVSLHPLGILWIYEDRTQACLAFTGKSHPSHVAIIGNRQQLSLKVVYDIEGGRLGFGNDCMGLSPSPNVWAWYGLKWVYNLIRGICLLIASDSGYVFHTLHNTP